MKQKIVIEVPINDEKSRKKAMKVAVGQSGVISAALEGDKNKIEVIGEGVDAVKLTTMLRKKVGFAQIQNVSEVKDKKEDEEKPAAENTNEPTVQPPPWSCYDVPVYPICESRFVHDPVCYPIYESCVVHDPVCTVM